RDRSQPPLAAAEPADAEVLRHRAGGAGRMKPPEECLARYGAVGLERLARVETAWFAISQGAGSTQMAESLRRDLHTLKGDSTLLEFEVVSKLCQRLEDLVSVATDREYDIGDELDHLVTMALQFTGMI